MEKLTIQLLAPYLPFSLMVKGNDGHTGKMVPEMGLEAPAVTIGAVVRNTGFYKPMLYPISCLTKTIQHEGREFCPIVELAKISFPKTELKWEICAGHAISGIDEFYYSKQYKSFFVIHGDETGIARNQWHLFQKLAEWHINFVGIPEGLYIDKNTLK